LEASLLAARTLVSRVLAGISQNKAASLVEENFKTLIIAFSSAGGVLSLGGATMLKLAYLDFHIVRQYVEIVLVEDCHLAKYSSSFPTR
jgi:hypothetical protein